MKSYMRKFDELNISKMLENGWKEFDPDQEFTSYKELLIVKTKHFDNDLECVICQYIPKNRYTSGDYIMPSIKVKHSLNREKILFYKDMNQLILK